MSSSEPPIVTAAGPHWVECASSNSSTAIRLVAARKPRQIRHETATGAVQRVAVRLVLPLFTFAASSRC